MFKRVPLDQSNNQSFNIFYSIVIVVSGCHILFLKKLLFLKLGSFCVFLYFHTYVSSLKNVMSTAYTYVQPSL